MAVTQGWQYKVIHVKPNVWGSDKPEDLQAALNTLGREGWEMVSVARAWGTGTTLLYLKRPA